jgi:hypothetical protein
MIMTNRSMVDFYRSKMQKDILTLTDASSKGNVDP